MESCKPTDQTNVKLIKGDLLHVTQLAKSRKPSTGPDLNGIISEQYNSDAFIEEHEKIQKQTHCCRAT